MSRTWNQRLIIGPGLILIEGNTLSLDFFLFSQSMSKHVERVESQINFRHTWHWIWLWLERSKSQLSKLFSD